MSMHLAELQRLMENAGKELAKNIIIRFDPPRAHWQQPRRMMPDNDIDDLVATSLHFVDHCLKSPFGVELLTILMHRTNHFSEVYELKAEIDRIDVIIRITTAFLLSQVHQSDIQKVPNHLPHASAQKIPEDQFVLERALGQWPRTPRRFHMYLREAASLTTERVRFAGRWMYRSPAMIAACANSMSAPYGLG